MYWEGNDLNVDDKITYKDLLSMTCRIANYLKSIGVKKGDDVTIYMPMLMELPAAMVSLCSMCTSTWRHVIPSVLCCIRTLITHLLWYMCLQSRDLISAVLHQNLVKQQIDSYLVKACIKSCFIH